MPKIVSFTLFIIYSSRRNHTTILSKLLRLLSDSKSVTSNKKKTCNPIKNISNDNCNLRNSEKYKTRKKKKKKSSYLNRDHNILNQLDYVYQISLHCEFKVKNPALNNHVLS